jgi:hypothetical protein
MQGKIFSKLKAADLIAWREAHKMTRQDMQKLLSYQRPHYCRLENGTSPIAPQVDTILELFDRLASMAAQIKNAQANNHA